MSHIAISWMVAGLTGGFLAICAGHNRRIGYRKTRTTEAPMDSAIEWLAALRSSMAATQPLDAHQNGVLRNDAHQNAALPLPVLSSPPLDPGELIRLDAALQPNEARVDAAKELAETVQA